MSISIKYQLPSLAPAYNQMIISLTSSIQSKENFNFVGDVFVRGVQVSRMKIPVNPQGYGVFDIHRQVENGVSYDFNPTSFGFNTATNSGCSYSVEFGEEYREVFEFEDNYAASGSKLGFVGYDNEPKPNFTTGQTINIKQTFGATNPQYDGTTTVVSLTKTGTKWYLVTPKDFGSSTPPESGKITLSDYKLSYNTTSSNVLGLAFNGVYGFESFIDYNKSKYIPSTTTPSNFLTTLPENYEVRLDSNMWINAFKESALTQKNMYIKSNRGTFKMISSKSANFTQIGVGPKQLIAAESLMFPLGTASFPILDSTSTEYEFWMTNISDIKDMRTYKVKINQDRCTRYKKIQLLFLDKMGSFIPYTFDLVHNHMKEVNRTEYKQTYGSYAPASQNWGYNSWDRGTHTLQTQTTHMYTIHTDWLDQKTSDYLSVLFESPVVYWYDEGKWRAINIKINDSIVPQVINQQIIKQSLTFGISQKDSSQRG
jgi:hypothetical protein